MTSVHLPLPTRERHVRHAARRGDDLDVEALLDAFQAVPQADAAAEQDWDLHDVEEVDEAGRAEVAHGRRAAADAHVEAAGRLPGEVERLVRARVDEVEHGAALHLE